MTDIATTEVEVAEHPDVVDAENQEQAAAEKPVKEKPQPKPCLCSTFKVGEEAGAALETTGCTGVTLSDFAQGHDAKLATFLAKAELNGDQIWQDTPDGEFHSTTASQAVSSISAKLQAKVEAQVAKGAEKRVARQTREAERNTARQAREAEKAERKAERERLAAEKKAAKEAEAASKAANQTAEVAGPRDVNVTVVAEEGDTPVIPEGQREARIKVGRWEYDAVIDENGTARFTNNDGVGQERAAGEYRELTA